MSNPYVSIIVPVYNAQQYLKRCLDSLASQTLKNIEIICINDGSTDESWNILQNYALHDNRFCIFNQENKGPATARNVGLQNVNSEFVMFCDADDEYSQSMCETMYNCIIQENVDLAMCNTQGYDRNLNKTNTMSRYYFPFDKERIDISDDVKLKMNVYLWNKIFRLSIIHKYKIHFFDGHKSDDNVFVWCYMAVSKSIFNINKKLYHHYDCPLSVMDNYYNNTQYKDLKDRMDGLLFFYNFLCHHNLFQENSYALSYITYQELIWSWLRVPDIWTERFLGDFKKVISAFCIDSKLPIEVKEIFYAIQKGNMYNIINGLDQINYNMKRFRNYSAHQNDIELHFSSSVPIVFNCDKNYIKFLSATILSIIMHSSSQNKYEFIILHKDIGKEDQFFIKEMIKEYPNFYVRFYHMGQYGDKYQINSWMCRSYITETAYYRLLIPILFKNLKKIIYLDCDIIVQDDIAELFHIDLKGNIIAAVKDHFISQIQKDKELCFPGFWNYAHDILCIKDISGYFNSGVMVFDIQKMNEKDIFDQFLNVAKINNRYFQDQNILNSVLQGNILYLDPAWNVQLNMSSEIYTHLLSSQYSSPKILHFCSQRKPWNSIPGRETMWNSVWWKYARKSIYYEQILLSYIEKSTPQIVKDALKYHRLYISYIFYCIKQYVTRGRSRRRYKNKRDNYHQRIQNVKKWMKNMEQ